MEPDDEQERKEANHSYWLQLMKRTSQVSRRISQSIQRTLNQRENPDGSPGDRGRGKEERGDGRRGSDNDSLQYSRIE